jgi:hypothetical protein
LSAGACVLTIAAQQQSFAVVSMAGLPLSRRIPHVLVSYMHYVGAMLVPRHLAAHYPYVPAPPAIEVAGAAILLALFSLLAFRLASRRPYLLVGWLWFLGTLVPVIGLVQVGDQACELTSHTQAWCLATLAAAFAEAGRFAEAVRTAETAQQRAAGASQTAMAAQYGSLLEAFKSGKPWREVPKGTAAAPTSSR